MLLQRQRWQIYNKFQADFENFKMFRLVLVEENREIREACKLDFLLPSIIIVTEYYYSIIIIGITYFTRIPKNVVHLFIILSVGAIR